MIETTPFFWDCDQCPDDKFIWPKAIPYCPLHGTHHEDSADSRVDEVRGLPMAYAMQLDGGSVTLLANILDTTHPDMLKIEMSVTLDAEMTGYDMSARVNHEDVRDAIRSLEEEDAIAAEAGGVERHEQDSSLSNPLITFEKNGKIYIEFRNQYGG